MARPDDLRDSAHRLVDWLASDYADDGTCKSRPDDVQHYYKLPAVFAFADRRALAQRVLDQFERRFLAREGFLSDDPVAGPWAAYIGGWAAWGSGALGRFDVARRIVAAIAPRQDPRSGGFWHDEPRGRLFDSERTSAAAMGCLWALDLPRARAAGRFLADAHARQREPGVFYAYSDADGAPVVEREDRNAHYRRGDPHARPALFATTIASLVWLHRATGELGPLEAASRYVRTVLDLGADAADRPLATKTGWAALLLHAHTREPALAAFARRNAEALRARQRPSGELDFSDVVDVPQPLDRVWSVGWGCDGVLTLLSAAAGAA